MPIAHRYLPWALLPLTLTTANAGPEILTTGQWRADIDQAVEAIQELHPMPAARLGELDLPSRAESLRAEVPDLDDRMIMLRLAELVAALDDGHSRLTLPSRHTGIGLRTGHMETPPPRDERLKLDHYPVILESFADGFHVTRARDSHKHLLGARLASVNGRPVDDILETIRPVIHHDNEGWFRRVAADRITMPGILQYFRIADGPGAVFRFQTADDTFRDERLEPLGEDHGAWAGVVDEASTTLLSRRHPGRPYWFQVLDEQNAIYVQFREATHVREDPPTQFVRRVLKEANEHDVSRLVLDLRDNHGGRGMWNQPFLKGLLGHPRFDQPGGLYVLTGPGTFSAAVLLVNELEQHTQAIFVGSPTGASPDHFGDAELVTLDHSGLTVRISTIFWKNWLAGEFRDAIKPHLPVPNRFEDLAESHDRALKTAVEHRFPDDPLVFFRHLIDDIGVNAAALYLGNLSLDPDLDNEFHRSLADLGNQYRTDGKLEKSRYVFLIADNYYPDHASIIAGLGQTLEEAGNAEEALSQYQRALELESNLAEAREGVRRLETRQR